MSAEDDTTPTTSSAASEKSPSAPEIKPGTALMTEVVTGSQPLPENKDGSVVFKGR